MRDCCLGGGALLLEVVEEGVVVTHGVVEELGVVALGRAHAAVRRRAAPSPALAGGERAAPQPAGRGRGCLEEALAHQLGELDAEPRDLLRARAVCAATAAAFAVAPCHALLPILPVVVFVVFLLFVRIVAPPLGCASLLRLLLVEAVEQHVCERLRRRPTRWRMHPRKCARLGIVGKTLPACRLLRHSPGSSQTGASLGLSSVPGGRTAQPILSSAYRRLDSGHSSPGARNRPTISW